MKFLACDNPIFTTANTVSCENWIIVDTQEFNSEITQPDPETLMLAFGSGLAVMLPLYAVLWGVRRARDALKQS